MEKTGLVLSGGGSRGAYEIGVWKALKELGEEINVVVGASVGAINSAIVAQDSLEIAERLWKELETSHIFDVALDESLPVKEKLRSAAKLFGRAAIEKGGAGTEALKRLLDEYIDEDAVRNSAVTFGMVTVTKKDMKPTYIWDHEMKPGQLCDWLIASSSLFPAIQAHLIDGVEYIDGGYANNMPIQMALRSGVTRIIAVNLDSLGYVPRDYTLGDCELIEIRSHWDLGVVLLFDPASARNNIRLGYLDAMRTFKVYEGFAYAFIAGTLAQVIRNYYRDFYAVMELLGFSRVRSKFIESLAFQAIQKRIFRRGENTSSRRGFALDGMESAAEMFKLDVQLLYSLDRFHEHLRLAVSAVSVPPSLPVFRGQNGPHLPPLEAVVDKRIRTKYLARGIFESVRENRPANFLPIATVMTDEFSAALYLALLYLKDGGEL